MNNKILSDELEIMQSIFCAVNEFHISTSGINIVLTINLESEHEWKLTLVFSDEYPNELPEMSLEGRDVTRTGSENMLLQLKNCAQNQRGEPMILPLSTFCRDLLLQGKRNSPESENSRQTQVSVQNPPYVMILHLDHMRSKAQYVKTILNWSQEFSLRGFLLLCQNRIFLLLQSDSKNLQNYLKQHRTQNVDLDSSGRPCKERLLKILFRAPLSSLTCQAPSLPPFSVHDFPQELELREFLELHECATLYSQYIQPVMQRNC